MEKTEQELEEIFKDGFALGFTEGKTRNIITQKYYNEVLLQAIKKWKNKNENTKS